MNEFGETPSIYVWPKDHEDGTAYPDDFWERVTKGLESVGIGWETV
jgi:hypothetical protein